MEKLSLYLFFLSLYKSNSEPISTTSPATNITTKKEEEIIWDTRRILRGIEITDTRPYMVYLRPTQSYRHAADQNWLCGGVIIDANYILTSAACIEDIKYFYVVSGTHRWLPDSKTNECIENGALRAVWKCVRRTYRFDGRVFNNIRWMVNDIAVVMTENPISFTKRVKGCDFIPKKIDYNNITQDLEKPGTRGFIAGWGSTDKYTDAADMLARTSVNSPFLLEAETIIVTKDNCKHHWLDRYYSIIEYYTFCGKIARSIDMSKACEGDQLECRQLVFSEEEGPRIRRFESSPQKLLLHSAAAVRKRERSKKETRRLSRPVGKTQYGGFCENDHGGPFIVGRGNSAIVVGIMTAYRVENNSKLCFGPFLYTSVYNNRHLIHCAMYKTQGTDCTGVLRDDSSVLEEETFDWGNIPIRQRTIYEDEDEPVQAPDNSETATPGQTDSLSSDATVDKQGSK